MTDDGNSSNTSCNACASINYTTPHICCSGIQTLVQNYSCFPADTGVIIDSLTSSGGCDSIVTTITTLINASFTTVNATSCNPADTGTVINTITGGAANGCDSIITTITTLINPSFTTVNATSCNPADTGTVVNTITGGAANGCDSIITTITTLINASFTTVNATSCNPADTGTVVNTITGGAANGCDSIITTIITLINPSFTTVNASSCNPADTGTVVNTITGGAANGCDSIITTITTLINPSFTTVNTTSCNPADTGTVVNTINGGAANGCDSIVTTITTLINASFTTVNATSCNPADTGTVVNTITGGAANGCDSIVTTITTLINASFTTVNATSCNPADTGTVVNTITGGAANGCDSIITTITTLINASFTTVNATSCNPADTGTVVNTITGGAANGCDSIVTTITTLITCVTPDTIYDTVPVNDTVEVCVNLEPTFDPAQTTYTFCDGSTADNGTLGTYEIDDNGCVTYVAGNTPGDENEICVIACDANLGICDTTIIIITVVPPTVTPDTIYDTVPVNDTVVVCVNLEPTFDPAQTTYTFCDGSTTGTGTLGTYEIDDNGCVTYVPGNTPGDENEICVIACDANLGICDTTIIIITVVPPTVTPDTIYDTVPVNDTVVVCVNIEPTFDPAQTTYTFCDGSTADNGTLGTYEIDDNGCVTYVAANTPGDENEICVIACDANLGICDTTIIIITVVPPTVTPDTIYDTVPVNDTVVVCVNLEPTFDPAQTTYTFCDGSTIGTGILGTYEIDDNGCVTYVAGNTPGDENEICVIACDANLGICDTTIIIITVVPPTVTPDTIYDTVPVNDTVVVCVNLEPTFDPTQTTYTFCDGSTTGTGTLGTYEIDDNGCVTYVASNTPGDESEICVIACDANLGICDTTIIIITVVPPTVTPDTIYDTVPVNDTVVVCVNLEPTFDPAQTTYTFCDGSTTGTGTLGTYEIDDNGCVTYVAGNTPGDENEICVIACDANLGICDTTIIIITVVPPTVTPDTIYDTVPVNDTVVVCVNLEPTFDPAQTTYTFCDGSTTGTGTLGTYEIDDNGCVTYVAGNTPGDENEICVIACDANLGICDTTIIIITVVPPTVTPDTIYDTVPVNDTVVVCVNIEPTFDPAQTTYTFCDGSTADNGTLGTYEIDDNGCVTYVAGNTPGDENEICVIACDANLGICDTTIIIITVVPPTVTPDTIYDTVPVNDTVVVCVNIEPTFDPAQTTYTFCDGSTADNGTLGTYEIDDNGCVTYVAGNTPGDENEICVIACDANLGICDTTIIIITVVPPTVTPDTIYDTVPVNDTVVVCVNLEPTFDPAQTTYTFCDGSTTGTGTLGTYEIDDNGCVTYVAANTPGDENEICVIACDANLGICDTTIIIITVVPPTVTPDTIYDTVPVNDTVVVCVNLEPTFDPAQTTYTFCDGSTADNGTLGTYEIDDNGCVTYVAGNTPGDENEICVIACDANLGICDTTIIIITVVPPTVTPDTIYDTVPVNDTVVVCINLEPTFDPAQTTYTFCDGSTTGTGTLGTYEIDDNGCVTYVSGNTPGDENEICVIACDANLGICDTTIIIITVVPPTVTPDTIYDTVPVNDTVVVCVNIEPTFDPAQTTYTFCDGSTTGTGTLGTYEIDDNGCVTYIAGNTPGDENEICVIACDANLGICDTTIIIITVVPPDCKDFIDETSATLLCDGGYANYCLAIPLI
ncbi:MAG: hypothetical protein K1X55_10200, partial [Chitinophagales bacterium]|nr:hypothetical protein [Chitinophagales bacterium]